MLPATTSRCAKSLRDELSRWTSGAPVTTVTEEYLHAVAEQTWSAMRARMLSVLESGRPLPEPEELVRSATLPPPALLSQELEQTHADIGPFYNSQGARLQLGGISRQALDNRRQFESVLAMRGTAGSWVYPVWQFTGKGGVRAEVLLVLRALRGADRWRVGAWLSTPHRDLWGLPPTQALAVRTDPDEVARLAIRDVIESPAET